METCMIVYNIPGKIGTETNIVTITFTFATNDANLIRAEMESNFAAAKWLDIK